MLSDTEPANRCAGFTHAGASHLWQTCGAPSGIGPKRIS
jgi:hypothetical protein